jgi:hypothetical protein
MATTKFTRNVPKKTPRKDIEDAGAPEPARGRRSPSKGARGQRADTSDADIRHKTRGTGKSKTGVKRTRSKNPGSVADEVEAAMRPDREGATARRNAKKRAPKATVALEGSDTGQPSRKSSRRGANRIKAGTELTRRETRRTSSPQKRAERAGASRAKTGGAGKGGMGPKARGARGR